MACLKTLKGRPDTTGLQICSCLQQIKAVKTTLVDSRENEELHRSRLTAKILRQLGPLFPRSHDIVITMLRTRCQPLIPQRNNLPPGRRSKCLSWFTCGPIRSVYLACFPAAVRIWVSALGGAAAPSPPGDAAPSIYGVSGTHPLCAPRILRL